MTTIEAWKTIRDAFKNYTGRISDNELAWYGLCYAVNLLEIKNCITSEQQCYMEDIIQQHKNGKGTYFFPLDKAGAEQRVALLEKIIAEEERNEH